MTEKVCRECGLVKTVENFQPVALSPDGYRHICRDCATARKEERERRKQDAALPETKWCAKCEQEKGRDHFYRDKGRKDGLAAWCKKCLAENTKASKERKKAPKRGYRRATGIEEKRILKAYKDTRGNISEVARRTRFDRDTVRKVIDRNKDKLHSDPAFSPDPIPFAELSDEAKRGLEEFLFFCKRFLGLEFEPWAERLAVELLEAYHSGNDEWLLVNIAFGAGKSTVVTYAFVCWVICRERAYGREPTIFLGHRAEARAKWYLRRVAQAFTLNRDLIAAYGRFKPDSKGATPWSTWELTVEPLDWSILREKEPTLAIGSYEGATMGGHFKIVIWDDLVDQKNATSSEQRKNVVEFADQTAESRPKPGGLFAYVGARFGPADLYADRKSQTYDDDLDPDGRPQKVWRQIVYKAHYDELCTGEHTRDMAAYPHSCLLSPVLVPWGRIRKAKLNERKYLLSYQQEDVDPEGSLADPVWFDGGTDKKGLLVPGCFDPMRAFGQAGRDDVPVLVGITVDPSARKFWAVIQWAVYPDGAQVVIRGLRKPLQAPELLYREADGRFTGVVEDWWQASKNSALQPRYLIVETRSQQTWLRQYEFVQTWCQNRGVVLLPHDTNRVNKADPTRGIEQNGPLYRQGLVRLPYLGPEERYFAEAFKKEATTWPEGDSDDMIHSHWFLTYNLPTLVAASQMEERYEDERPEWARVETPEWAKDTITRSA